MVIPRKTDRVNAAMVTNEVIDQGTSVHIPHSDRNDPVVQLVRLAVDQVILLSAQFGMAELDLAVKRGEDSSGRFVPRQRVGAGESGGR